MKKNPKWLETAAVRSSDYSWTLGSVLKDYCNLEQLAQADLANYLCCDMDVLHWLSLCRNPRPDHFAEDVGCIAKKFRLDTSKLASIVRRVEVIKGLRQGFAPATEDPVLLAARDRQKEKKP
jgi:hypothetical protein